MADMSSAVHYAGKHPVTVGLGVVAVGLFLMLMFRKPAASDNGMNAFYAAQASQASSGNSLLAVQKQAAAAVAINGQNTEAAVAINAANTNAAVAINSSNNVTASDIVHQQMGEAHWETWKQVRLQTQDAERAQYLSSTSGNPAYYLAYLETAPDRKPIYSPH